jgi:hypothetical protein
VGYSLHRFSSLFMPPGHSPLTLFATAEGLALHQPKGGTKSSTGKSPASNSAELVLVNNRSHV